MGRKAFDLAGQKFGRLTVIQRAGTNKHRATLWLCQCECGNTTTVATQDLTRGHTQSCGCLRRECTSERMKKLMKKVWSLHRETISSLPNNSEGTNHEE